MKPAAPHVWIVDDDEGMCNAIEYLLSPMYEVTSFLSLEELDKAICDNRPDLLILDIMFNKIESAGLDYLEHLRELWSYLPVVICSVRNDAEAGCTAGNLGVTKFVVKDAKPRSFSKILRDQVKEALDEAVLNLEIASILNDPAFFKLITGKTLEDCDGVVQTAIRLFLKHIRETGPSVEKLAEITGFCAGTLNNHFRKHFKQSVGDFITYLATIIGCKILQHGYGISKAAGFVGMGPERFRQRVQAEFGKAPSEIRESDLP